MRLSFQENFFSKNKIYRLEAVRAIKKDNIFTHLTVNFFPLYKNRTLNELKKLSYNNSYSQYFDCIGREQYKRSIILEVEVALLPLLSPGSIWVADDTSSIKRVFNPNRKETISIGQNRRNTTYEKEKKELNSLENFKFLKNDKKLNLLAISDSVVRNQKTTVLIPHSEIVRFYFGASKYFTRRLFMEDAVADNAHLIGKAKDNIDLCSIRLNSRHYLDSDVPFIAQALLNKTTMRAMRMIYSYANNLHNHSKNNDYEDTLFELPLKTTLPFDEKTKLDVIGHFVSKESSNADSKERCFLVRQIVTSYHNWAFRNLEIISAENFPNQQRTDYTNNIRNQPTQIHEDDANLIIGDNPNAENPELDVLLDNTERFPFLNTMEVEKVISNELTQENSDENIGTKEVLVNQEITTSEGSLEVGNYQQNSITSPAQLTHNRNQSEIKSFSDISEIFYEIAIENKDWSITSLPTSKINQSKPYGEFQFNHSSWSRIDGRYRRALLLKVDIIDREPVYCLEVESDDNRRYGIYLFSGIKPNINLKPLELMETIDKQQGNKIKKLLYRYYNNIIRLNHTNIGNSLKERIVKKIINI